MSRGFISRSFEADPHNRALLLLERDIRRLASTPGVRLSDIAERYPNFSRLTLAEIICARAEAQPDIPQSQRRRAAAAGRHLQ